MSVTVGILSGKGGAAKTTTALNLAAAFNHFGREVVLVDGNLSTPNVGLHLGVPIVPINLHHVVKGHNHITEAVYMHHSGMKFVPAGISINDLSNTVPEKMSKVLHGLHGLADIIVVDGAPGLGREALSVMDSVDDIIVVTNPELPAVTDALKTIKFAEGRGKKIKGIVIAKSGKNYDISFENIQALLEKPILAVIPEDSAIRESLVQKDAVVHTHPKSKSSIAYKKLAADLIGMEYDVEYKESFWKRIFNRKV